MVISRPQAKTMDRLFFSQSKMLLKNFSKRLMKATIKDWRRRIKKRWKNKTRATKTKMTMISNQSPKPISLSTDSQETWKAMLRLDRLQRNWQKARPRVRKCCYTKSKTYYWNESWRPCCPRTSLCSSTRCTPPSTGRTMLASCCWSSWSRT